MLYSERRHSLRSMRQIPDLARKFSLLPYSRNMINIHSNFCHIIISLQIYFFLYWDIYCIRRHFNQTDIIIKLIIYLYRIISFLSILFRSINNRISSSDKFSDFIFKILTVSFDTDKLFKISTARIAFKVNYFTGTLIKVFLYIRFG